MLPILTGELLPDIALLTMVKIATGNRPAGRTATATTTATGITSMDIIMQRM